MAVPVLFELNQELTRLFAAGSRLAAEDPRLKKLLGPLTKYGEKAPVFLKLAQQVQELLQTEAGQSAQKLLEAQTLLLSVLSTQGDTAPAPGDSLKELGASTARAEEEENPAAEQETEPKQGDRAGWLEQAAAEPFGPTSAGYRTLSPVIEALRTTGGGRMEVIKSAYERGLFQDPRLLQAAVCAMGDKYTEIADYMAYTVLPSMGESALPFLMSDYHVKGGAVDGRRLAAIHKMKADAMLGLVDEAVNEASVAVKVEAVKIMAGYPQYESILLSMLSESKAVREEAIRSLIALDSREGIDKLLVLFQKGKADIRDIILGRGEYLTNELLKMAQADHMTLKLGIEDGISLAEQTAAARRLRSELMALCGKASPASVAFFEALLLDTELENTSKQLLQAYPGESLTDLALAALYESRQGNDLIWKLFLDAQGGLIDQLLPRKKKNDAVSDKLYLYAFRAGAHKLSADAFYNVFFKSGLYNRVIYRLESSIFYNTFLTGENRPAYSEKIARLLAEDPNDHHVYLAAQLVKPGDTQTLKLLAEFMKKKLAQKSYQYYYYRILGWLGEAGYQPFHELFDLYYETFTSSIAERAYLEKFVKRS